MTTARTAIAALVAALGGLTTVLDLLVLRAASDGRSPSGLVLLAVGLVTAAALFPLVRRTSRGAVVVAALAVAQVLGHLVLLASTSGRVGHGGVVGLVCCPATAGATGPLATLTGSAGVVLLLAQLACAVVMGLALVVSRKTASDGVAALVPFPRLVLTFLRAVVVLVVTPTDRPVVPARARVRPLRSVLIARASTRRGPPQQKALALC